jgi:hypothetical protein
LCLARLPVASTPPGWRGQYREVVLLAATDSTLGSVSPLRFIDEID